MLQWIGWWFDEMFAPRAVWVLEDADTMARMRIILYWPDDEELEKVRQEVVGYQENGWVLLEAPD